MNEKRQKEYDELERMFKYPSARLFLHNLYAKLCMREENPQKYLKEAVDDATHDLDLFGSFLVQQKDIEALREENEKFYGKRRQHEEAER